MAHGRSLELRKIQPVDRVHEAMPPSLRRGHRGHRHTRVGPQRDTDGLYKVWHTTKRRPWTLRAERRAANKRARRTRREARR